jgi:hypothetical protein
MTSTSGHVDKWLSWQERTGLSHPTRVGRGKAWKLCRRWVTKLTRWSTLSFLSRLIYHDQLGSLRLHFFFVFLPSNGYRFQM